MSNTVCDACICREREEPPRFARPGTFEFEYAKRWKSLDEMEKQQRQQVEKNILEAREKLESEMDDAYHEHQANLLRQGECLRGVEETTCPAAVHVFFCQYWFVLCKCFGLFPRRSAEAAGGAAAYGGDAQSGDAEEEGNAAQVGVFDETLPLPCTKDYVLLYTIINQVCY